MKTISLAGESHRHYRGTQGIGAAISLDAARAGAAGVCICGRNADNGNQMVAALEKLGTKAFYLQSDLADVAATQALCAMPSPGSHA